MIYALVYECVCGNTLEGVGDTEPVLCGCGCLVYPINTVVTTH